MPDERNAITQPIWKSRLEAIMRRQVSDRSLTPGEAGDALVALQYQESRVDVLGFAVDHVLRYGKLGKQSKARLRAAIRAVNFDRG